MTDEKEFIEDNYEGFGEDSDPNEGAEDLVGLTPKEVSQAALSGADWTTETILIQINKGNILLDPKFQRRDAWDKKRKSAFIESLLLNLPVPQIILAEVKDQKGKYLVIDGKQRLLSIRQFAAKTPDDKFGQLKLIGLQIRGDLIGKALEELRNDLTLYADLSAFENSTIRTVVIKNWPDEIFLYSVFLRLNTGSVPLSPQELRQALHPGRFIDFADDYSGNSPALRAILKITKPDYRMRDVELLIRYLAFKNFLEGYTGNFKEFLDRTCKTFNNEWKSSESLLSQQVEDFEQAYLTICSIFSSKNAFRKWKGTSYEARFNRAIFDIMIFYFSRPEIRQASSGKEKLLEQRFKELCVDDFKFLGSIERSIKNLESVQIRFSAWAKALNEILSLTLPLPAINDGKIAIS